MATQQTLHTTDGTFSRISMDLDAYSVLLVQASMWKRPEIALLSRKALAHWLVRLLRILLLASDECLILPPGPFDIAASGVDSYR